MKHAQTVVIGLVILLASHSVETQYRWSMESSGVAFANSLALKARFQSELETLHDQYQFPGVTAAYILPDGTIEVIATGLADVELKIPMTPQSRMLAASIGKTFVGATVVALAQEGVLSLDDPISKWLGDRPWFSRLPNHDIITLRQLLPHSSGIANHVDYDKTHPIFNKTRDEKGYSAIAIFTLLNPLGYDKFFTNFIVGYGYSDSNIDFFDKRTYVSGITIGYDF